MKAIWDVLIFVAMKCFTEHISFCFLICQNFSKVSTFLPKTYLYIFYSFEKSKKGGGGAWEKYPLSPQQAELHPRSKEPRDSSPKVLTFRHLVIPCSHTKSRHMPFQTLARTLPSPEVSPGAFRFDFERFQGEAAQQSWMCTAEKGVVAAGERTGTLGTMGCGGLLALQALVLHILPLVLRPRCDASVHQERARARKPLGELAWVGYEAHVGSVSPRQPYGIAHPSRSKGSHGRNGQDSASTICWSP